MTITLPTIVKTTMSVMAVANAAVASGEYGANFSMLWLQGADGTPLMVLLFQPVSSTEHALSTDPAMSWVSAFDANVGYFVVFQY